MNTKQIAKALGADKPIKLSRKPKGPIDWLAVPEELRRKPNKKQLQENFKKYEQAIKKSHA